MSGHFGQISIERVRVHNRAMEKHRKEKDEGKLLAHNAFWNTSGDVRMDATITEFIFVPNAVDDGEYLLNLMIAPFENDATPSKPILYKILVDEKTS